MVFVEKRSPFVYGDFNLPAQRGVRLTPPPGHSPYAIEILREFSASEFIGKLYQLTPSLQWSVLRPEDANLCVWYQIALKNPHMVKFNMQGSGAWTIQNLRAESDDKGPYVAVALSKK